MPHSPFGRRTIFYAINALHTVLIYVQLPKDIIAKVEDLIKDLTIEFLKEKKDS